MSAQNVMEMAQNFIFNDEKKLVDKGWRVDSGLWEDIKYKELSNTISQYDRASGNLAEVVKNSAADGFGKGLNILEDFKPSNYKDVDF